MGERPDSKPSTGVLRSVLDELPMDRLKDEAKGAMSALAGKAVSAAGDRVASATDKLTELATGDGISGKAKKEGAKAMIKGESPVLGALKGGLSGLKDKATEVLGGGGSKRGGGRATKSTNIIEDIDVGVPIDVAYNTWTEFQEFSNFMKKVEGVEQKDDTKVDFKAKIVWSHRTWEATILEQVPDERIIWRSKGQKGHVDGSVTFHELAPNLTRILLVLEYYPQGLFERTGNIWRAQGRRARLELKHFRRHVMMNVAQHPDEVEGWRGVIHESEVERTHDEVVEEEEQARDDQEDLDDEYDDEYDDESGESGDDEPQDDEADENGDGPEDEYDDASDEADDEYDDESQDDESDDDEGPEDEYDEPEDDGGDDREERAPRRKRSRTR